MVGFDGMLVSFAGNYLSAKKETFGGHRLSKFMRKEIPDYLNSKDLFEKDEYKIAGSVGKGNWAQIPWLAFFKLSETDTLHHGLFIAYIFSSDMSRLYLSINQGAVTFYDSHNLKDTKEYLVHNSEFFTSKLRSEGFSDGPLELLTDSHVGSFLELGNIFCKEYEVTELPSEEKMFEDLRNAKKLYLEALSVKDLSGML